MLILFKKNFNRPDMTAAMAKTQTGSKRKK